ncbi:hypothetical protein RHGRI_003731 [Rhododendron griersonianum]|uniref:Uncharacterized protein n=1 Tax=Rhododendron griersonianum TaxID=479676 RepID=A0AAV6L6C7_9ERIC|nr:hypothetical protein RHGRI_003731 [Rhododendron griersonianum]
MGCGEAGEVVRHPLYTEEDRICGSIYVECLYSWLVLIRYGWCCAVILVLIWYTLLCLTHSWGPLDSSFQVD